MRLKVSILILTLYNLSETAICQNLLLNGGFEDCKTCIESDTLHWIVPHFSCDYWSCPNGSSPILLKECSRSFDYPQDKHFYFPYQKPQSGEVCAGLMLLNGNNLNYREYIRGELREKLVKGSTYEIKYYISLDASSMIFSRKIGYAFSALNTPSISSYNEKLGFSDKSNVLSKSDGFIYLNRDTMGDWNSWSLIKGLYVAKGNEKYLTLGLFEDNASKDEIMTWMSEAGGSGSVYRLKTLFFIDDIFVTKKQESE
jgi:hypothetical protein